MGKLTSLLFAVKLDVGKCIDVGFVEWPNDEQPVLDSCYDNIIPPKSTCLVNTLDTELLRERFVGHNQFGNNRDRCDKCLRESTDDSPLRLVNLPTGVPFKKGNLAYDCNRTLTID